MPRPARPWFRFYVEALSDRKLRRLTPAQRWLWVAVLGAARQSCIPGYLMVSEREPMDASDLADIAAMTVKDVEVALPKFEMAGMLTRNTDLNCWAVTAWDARQFESDDVTARTTKHRTKERSNVPPKTVPTPFQGTPASDTETETDTDSSSSSPSTTGLPSGLWMMIAEKKAATTTSVIADPSAWKRKAADNARAELEARAVDLVTRYDLTTPRLVDALVSPSNPAWLNHHRRRETA